MKIKTSILSISFPPEGVWNHEGQEPRHGGRREKEVRDETTSGDHIPEEEILKKRQISKKNNYLCRLYVMHSPQVVRVGSKKTAFANFSEIAKMLHRQPKVQILAFVISSFVVITFRDLFAHFSICSPSSLLSLVPAAPLTAAISSS